MRNRILIVDRLKLLHDVNWTLPMVVTIEWKRNLVWKYEYCSCRIINAYSLPFIIICLILFVSNYIWTLTIIVNRITSSFYSHRIIPISSTKHLPYPKQMWEQDINSLPSKYVFKDIANLNIYSVLSHHVNFIRRINI